MDDITSRLAAPMIFIIIALIECVPKYFKLQTKIMQTISHSNNTILAFLCVLCTYSTETSASTVFVALQNGGAMSDEEKKLRAEIKQLLKEASTLTQPSTFAQAAKLRRMAAAKEKELAKYQEQQMMERKSSYDLYMKYLIPVKALTYLVLGVWFWKSPVAAIPKELVQPIGGILSFRSGARSKDKVMVGVVAWILLCRRVGNLIFGKFVA